MATNNIDSRMRDYPPAAKLVWYYLSQEGEKTLAELKRELMMDTGRIQQSIYVLHRHDMLSLTANDTGTTYTAERVREKVPA